MREHVFLCGLSAEQRSRSSDYTVLSLERKVGNLKLTLDWMRRKLVGSEPKRLTDFIEIASYVFAADRITSRGQLWDPGVGEQWRRSFRLVIAVRDLEFWQRSDVKATLCEALGFLSEDFWRFEFVANEHPIELQKYLNLKGGEKDSGGDTSIVLFSGGLDSLAGAVHELMTSNRYIVLVSHRNLPIAGARQAELAGKLISAHPRRLTHVSVDNSLTKKLPDNEATQRTRSFFFAAIASVAAHIERADRIRFYENGVMSVNLPFATQVVGARASRSTHPRSLELISRVVDLVSSHPIEVDNPFLWKTKGEVVSELVGSKHASLITRSLSCTRSRTANKTFKPHCGTCIQCIQRRISTLAGGAGDLDESDGYDADFLVDPREDGNDRTMALGSVNLALECADMSSRDFVSRFADPLSWLLRAYPNAEHDDVTKSVIDLYRRHGVAVRKILIDAAQPQVPAMLDRTLPPNSLLALIMASKLTTNQIAAPEPAPNRLPEPRTEHATVTGIENVISVAVDPGRHRILISDRPELRGPAIFPIMKLLIEASMKDRGGGLLTRHYRSFPAKVIAALLVTMDDEAVRSAIKRAREEFAEAEQVLHGAKADPNAIIERVPKGYRLNPNVTALTLDEYNRR